MLILFLLALVLGLEGVVAVVGLGSLWPDVGVA